MKENEIKTAASESVRLPGALPSLILGILTYLALGPFGAIPAVIAGHSALSKYAREPAKYYGRRMAVAGLVLGYLGIILSIIALICIILTGQRVDSAPYTLF